MDGLRKGGQGFRHLQLAAENRVVVDMGVLLQVEVQARSQGNAVSAGDADPAVPAAEGEAVGLPLRLGLQLKGKAVDPALPQYPADQGGQLPEGLFPGIGGILLKAAVFAAPGALVKMDHVKVLL